MTEAVILICSTLWLFRKVLKFPRKVPLPESFFSEVPSLYLATLIKKLCGVLFQGIFQFLEELVFRTLLSDCFYYGHSFFHTHLPIARQQKQGKAILLLSITTITTLYHYCSRRRR